jgi:DNA-binding transcriptional ArsR family regulator
MSQSTVVRACWEPADGGPEEEADADRLQEPLDALQDAECRAILSATSDAALSAKEVSKRCELPRSTVYRKLDQLTDAGLLAEHTRVRRTGKHTSVYRRTVDGVCVSVTDAGEFRLRLRHRPEGDHPRGDLEADA